MALRISRFEPNGLMGLMPSPASSKNLTPISSLRKRASLRLSSVPDWYSMPEYTSSLFSRKMTTSTSSGFLSGDGTPG